MLATSLSLSYTHTCDHDVFFRIYCRNIFAYLLLLRVCFSLFPGHPPASLCCRSNMEHHVCYWQHEKRVPMHPRAHTRSATGKLISPVHPFGCPIQQTAKRWARELRRLRPTAARGRMMSL